jgi:hypothetical protein
VRIPRRWRHRQARIIAREGGIAAGQCAIQQTRHLPARRAEQAVAIVHLANADRIDMRAWQSGVAQAWGLQAIEYVRQHLSAGKVADQS